MTRRQAVSLQHILTLIKETAMESAPRLQSIGAAIDEIGEQTEMATLEKIGEGVKTGAKMMFYLLQLIDNNNDVLLMDESGTRSLEHQMIAAKMLQQLKA